MHTAYELLPVDYNIPEYEEVTWTVHRLHRNRSGVLLIMREDHLRYWLHAATWEKSPDTTN